ncbi:hypothetical protein [Hydrogenophaga sp.]|uniref:hypothetical protein n=1 Tax=Hydrogenophaga sp. TaxID=1904254 RepID=UPI003D0E785D
MSDKEDEFPLNRWGAPIGDGLIHLQDLEFDFEDYFSRFPDNMSDDEKRDFSARVYGMFCRDFYKSGGDPAALKSWVVGYIADKIHQALGGVPWNDLMGLPWDEPKPMFTPKGQRAFDIYAGVKNENRDDPTANVTDLIAKQASLHHVSFETARSDFYAMKRAIEWKQGMPEKFLNRSDDS